MVSLEPRAKGSGLHNLDLTYYLGHKSDKDSFDNSSLTSLWCGRVFHKETTSYQVSNSNSRDKSFYTVDSTNYAGPDRINLHQ